MSNFRVSVEKLTTERLVHMACTATTGNASRASLSMIYRSEHSPVRTQIFWISLKDIKQCVASHLVRHHVGSIPFQLSCREDRPGGHTSHTELIERVKELLKNTPDNEPVSEEVYARLNWIQEFTDRNTRVNLSLCVNAQSLIDMAKLRLCNMAHPETRAVVYAIRDEISKIDPDLAAMMVRKCVYRNGLCGEPACCAFNASDAFKKELEEYLSHFNPRQKGIPIKQ